MFEWIKQGIGYILGWIYELVPNYGVALILFTFAIKLLLLPLGLKQQKSMTKMQVMQPKLEALKEKYKNDQQKLSQETMKLYKEYNISPMGGCLPMLIQLPILILLYRVIQQPLEYMLHLNSGEISKIAAEFGLKAKEQIMVAKEANLINFDFFGLDLSGNPNDGGWFKLPMLIPVFAAVTTYLSSKVSMIISKKKNEDTKEQKPTRILSPEQKDSGKPNTAEVGKTMTWMMPILTFYITSTFYSAIGIYWIASNIFSVGQTILLNGYYAKKMTLEIEAHEAELAERKQLRYGNKKRKGN
ncbi:MAG: YidC/Oxa1 family membrane protein insertase [Clostridia bacterium]|nr:YidC/Oxa1 family membrane protein insertase [Clostridia bacterium]